MVKLRIYDSSLFIVLSLLLFQWWSTTVLNISNVLLNFKKISCTEKVVSSKSKGLSTKKLTTPTTTVNSLSPSTNWCGYSSFCLTLKGNCLRQKNATPPNRINFFLVYKLEGLL